MAHTEPNHKTLSYIPRLNIIHSTTGLILQTFPNPKVLLNLWFEFKGDYLG